MQVRRDAYDVTTGIASLLRVVLGAVGVFSSVVILTRPGEYVNILFDAESYEGLSRWNGGESGVKVILHHASSYPTFTSKVIYLQPGAVNHVTLQATSVTS